MNTRLLLRQSLLVVCLLLGWLAAPPAAALTWSNCSTPMNSQFELLSFNPDAWVAGGNDTLSFKFSLGTAIGSTNDVTIHVEHRVNGRLLPCLGALTGSCDYKVCDALDQHFTDVWGGPDCPLSKWGIVCQCPYNRGTYLVDGQGLTFAVPEHLERFRGHNTLHITGRTAAGSALFCINMSFNISP
ncbi:MAG: ML domain-containing protein [Rhodanobacteraceae bacterium]